MREEEPTKTKSWAVLLWQCRVWQTHTNKKKKHKNTVSGYSEKKIRSCKRHSTTSASRFLPGMVWVHSHWCWSAKDSNLHQRLQYQTTKDIQISDPAAVEFELRFILHLIGDKNTLLGASDHRGTVSPFRWFKLSLNYLSKHFQRLMSPNPAYITEIKCSACPLFFRFFFLKHISLFWPERAHKIALAQERHHLRKWLAWGERLSSERLNHSAEEQCVLKPNSPLRFVPEWRSCEAKCEYVSESDRLTSLCSHVASLRIAWHLYVGGSKCSLSQHKLCEHVSLL